MKRVVLVLGVVGLSVVGFGFGGVPGAGGPGARGGPVGGPGGPDWGGFGGFGGGPGMPGFEGMGMEDPGVVQKRIGATAEEWTVIWAKLQKVMHLRSEVEATVAESNPFGGNMMLGAPGMPGGGNSLEGPATQGGGGAAGPGGPGGPGGAGGAIGMLIGGFMGTGRGPFAAPPAVQQGGGGGFGPPGGFGGGFGMLSVGEENAVATLLGELQTLVADKSATDEQLKEKLETIRATRHKAQVDLLAAEEDVMRLLTLKQTATLTALGYLD